MNEKEEQVELRPVEAEDIRTVEAVLFAAEEPLDAPNIADKLAAGGYVTGHSGKVSPINTSTTPRLFPSVVPACV